MDHEHVIYYIYKDRRASRKENNMNYEDMLREFHVAYGLPNNIMVRRPTQSQSKLRQDLLVEEMIEYLQAEREHKIVDIADALADIVYIAIGTAVAYGIPFDEVFKEVHRSNMSKLDESGLPIYRGDGKVLKGENFTPPNLEDILFKK